MPRLPGCACGHTKSDHRRFRDHGGCTCRRYVPVKPGEAESWEAFCVKQAARKGMTEVEVPPISLMFLAGYRYGSGSSEAAGHPTNKEGSG